MKQSFEHYLAHRNQKPYTICQAQRVVEKFLNWLKENGNSAPRVSNSTVISYIEDQQKQNLEVITINLKLAQLTHYYNYLGNHTNPFEGVRVKGHRYRVYTNLLSENELMELYIELPEETDVEKRVKLLTGLYVFQGISTRDLGQLRIWHLNMEVRTIIIPHTPRGNKRILHVHPLQIPILKQLHELDNETALYRAFGEAQDFNWINIHLKKSLQVYPNYKSLYQLRHSVVMNWLKRHNLRQVQYNAGHRYISTTEKYRESDFEELRIAIIDKHPLG